MWGIVGVQKEIVLAAKHCIVTVEEIVDDIEAPPNACVLPAWSVQTVCEVPGGAFPSYAHGYYERDNAAYLSWDTVSKCREHFMEWMDKHVVSTDSFAEFRSQLAS